MVVPHSCFVAVSTSSNKFRCNAWRSPSCYNKTHKQSTCLRSHSCHFVRASKVLKSCTSSEHDITIIHNKDDDSLFQHDRNQVWSKHKHLARGAYTILGVASAMAWMAVSFCALSYHPDPKFVDCTMRHTVLTVGQAFAFSLPVGWAAFQALHHYSTTTTSATTNNPDATSSTFRRLNLGVALASLWLAAASYHLHVRPILHLAMTCTAPP